MSNSKTFSVRDMVFAALFAAVLCAVAPFSISIGPVPLSFATLVIYLAAGVLDIKTSLLSVLLYILMGAIGLPVFSGFGGGFNKIIGVTGGFIVGYIPLALAVGIALRAFGKKTWLYASSMVVGTFVLYAIGTVWFVAQSGRSVSAALTLCVVPFLPGDVAKIIVACLIAPRLREITSRASRRRG